MAFGQHGRRRFGSEFCWGLEGWRGLKSFFFGGGVFGTQNYNKSPGDFCVQKKGIVGIDYNQTHKMESFFEI